MATAHAAAPRAAGARRAATLPLRILIGAAGDDSSTGAVHLARALAKRSRAVVQVLTVTTPFPHLSATPFEVSPPAVIDADNRRAALAAVQDQLGAVHGTQRWTVHAVVGWPAEALLDEAKRWPASLLLVGIGRHHAVDRLFGPETAVAVARHADVPMIAVTPETRELPRRIVAAVDFTAASTGAAHLAARLLVAGGTLTLVHVSPLVVPHTDGGSLVDVYTAGASEKLERLRDEIHQKTRRRVETVLLPGQVVEQVLALSHRLDAEMIALGGHELGLLERVFMGSVRSRIIRDAHCSVLVRPG